MPAGCNSVMGFETIVTDDIYSTIVVFDARTIGWVILLYARTLVTN